MSKIVLIVALKSHISKYMENNIYVIQHEAPAH